LAFINDVDRTVFDSLCKGFHDFTEEELKHLHQIAEEVKGIVQASVERQDRAMMARNQLRQMGPLSYETGVINEAVPFVPQPTNPSVLPNEVDQSHKQWE
jgi:hypothetical protein